MLNSKSRALALEKQLWEELFDLLMPHLEQLQQLAASVAQLDVLQTSQSAQKTWNIVAQRWFKKRAFTSKVVATLW